ncbi:hypothetical protein VTK26DRAFT_4698 [Humicola hyalothermophila]
MLVTMPSQRLVSTATAAVVACLLILGLALPSSGITFRDLLGTAGMGPAPKPTPRYKPPPKYLPPPVKDNFPLLATSTPPPVPEWNKPRPDLHTEYDLPLAPPLLIGFTRSWPLLLQAVVSYITAGWPASQIYVVENTGVQQANARGQLTLQNPFYLNHTTLRALGVNVITTPTLLSFAQLQNFFLSLTYAHNWPYYFWSHMDVLVLSYEGGLAGHTPPYDQPGYKTVYELALTALRAARGSGPRWGARFFAYDHLALVNPAAYEDVGGWDTLVPYYMTDCDMHSRLMMRNWNIEDASAGIITDVAAALDDLRVLYRVDGVEPTWTDPNPPPPPSTGRKGWFGRRGVASGRHEKEEDLGKTKEKRMSATRPEGEEDPNLARWHAIRLAGDGMFNHKHGDRERNTWQLGQHGGNGEPFYYPADGFAEGLEILTEAGREVFRRKWGHRDCDLIDGAGLGYEDQWQVKRDYWRRS